MRTTDNKAVAPTETFAGVYRSVTSGCIADLPPCVSRFHLSPESIRAHGTVQVRHGRRPLARLLAWMLRFPRASEAVALDVVIVRRSGREEWLRSFGGRALRSTQSARGSCLEERFGLFGLRYAVNVVGPVLVLRSVGAALHLGGLRIAIPRSLGPRVAGRASESSEGGAMNICVSIHAPIAGLVLAYDGAVEEVT